MISIYCQLIEKIEQKSHSSNLFLYSNHFTKKPDTDKNGVSVPEYSGHAHLCITNTSELFTNIYLLLCVLRGLTTKQRYFIRFLYYSGMQITVDETKSPAFYSYFSTKVRKILDIVDLDIDEQMEVIGCNSSRQAFGDFEITGVINNEHFVQKFGHNLTVLPSMRKHYRINVGTQVNKVLAVEKTCYADQLQQYLQKANRKDIIIVSCGGEPDIHVGS